MKKALIAMSGGVDSSVAALLMKENGYECSGANMRLYESSTCCSPQDVEDARAVCDRLDMEFHVFDFKEDFKHWVIEDFVACYECGCTPNPCIQCNRHLKFDRFYDAAMELGCDVVVTGHYVQIAYDEATGRYQLKKALDHTKDQSYVLYSLTQEQLAHTMFPLGGMTKEAARQLALEKGFVNAKKHDSQDICFVPDGDYASFITEYTGKSYEPGDFVDEDGNVVGRHKGIIHYTIGQRKGLGVSADRPYYVSAIDVENNQVVLTKDPNKSMTTLYAKDINLIAVDEITEPMRLKAKIRYRSQEQWCTVKPHGPGEIEVVFDEPQRAITKGQACVLYDDDIVVGGGTIYACF